MNASSLHPITLIAARAETLPANPIAIGLGVMFGLVAGCLFLALIWLYFWSHWRIMERAGYPGIWSLWLLAPAGSLIGPAIFAFMEWPIERELKTAREAASRTSA